MSNIIDFSKKKICRKCKKAFAIDGYFCEDCGCYNYEAPPKPKPVKYEAPEKRSAQGYYEIWDAILDAKNKGKIV